MRRVELLPVLRDYLRYLGGLDERSLACCRMLFALVVLHDVSMAWPVLDIWAGLQGYYEGLPLPFLALDDSGEWFLRAVFACYALAAVGLLLGYRTRWCSLGVWVMACGHQYAAGNAGGAMSAYAAACGLPATVFMPQDTPQAFAIECQSCGAAVEFVDGLISDCGRIVGEPVSYKHLSLPTILLV